MIALDHSTAWNGPPITITVMTVSDLHQLRGLYAQLAVAVAQHRPHLLAIVGDALEAIALGSDHLSVPEAAGDVAELPVEYLIFTRGNHEDENWLEFAKAWPRERRPLVALHGTAYQVGPLAVIGFPCRTCYEGSWLWSLPQTGNVVVPDASPHRKALPKRTRKWLDPLMRRVEWAGAALWLMHEPPLAEPICRADLLCREWARAVWRHKPKVVVCGHDHSTPLNSGAWKGWLGDSLVLNAGQRRDQLHYLILKFHFGQDGQLHCLQLQAFPSETLE